MGTFHPYEVDGIQTAPDGSRYPHGAMSDDFKPKYLCLAYIKYEPAGASVRHAYFRLPPNLQAFATAELASISATGQWASQPIREEVNFENFTFGSQQLIVFHIDPAGAAVRFDPANLVQFAEWSARGPKTPATLKSRNNCFLNPKIKSWPSLEVLSLENWYADDAGKPIPMGVELYYAMNLHTLMKCVLPGSSEGFSDLPLVLDPDTGNMGGQP